MITRTIRFTISYDGTNYSGWQVQPDKKTVQGSIEDALTVISNETCHLIGASRTDAGVHAVEQVASARIRSKIPTENIRSALNSILPKDISITEAIETLPDFHARLNALAKRYIYRIYTRKTRDPFLNPYSWHVPERLDIDKIRASLPIFPGEHDFSSFSVVDRDSQTGNRKIIELDLIEDKDQLTFKLVGNGFLRKQIRRMVGTLIDVGKGRFTPEQVGEILLSRDPSKAGPTAPPQGLFLMKVYYNPI